MTSRNNRAYVVTPNELRRSGRVFPSVRLSPLFSGRLRAVLSDARTAEGGRRAGTT